MREITVDNPSNASRLNTGQNRHTSWDNVNPQISAVKGVILSPKLPSSISQFDSARQ